MDLKKWVCFVQKNCADELIVCYLPVQNGQINTTVASLLVFTAETLDGKPPFYLFIYLKFIICWQIYKIYYKNILLIYCNYAKNSAC